MDFSIGILTTFAAHLLITDIMMLNVQPQMLFSMPSGGELIWILLIIVLLFGAKKIPDLARGIGLGMKEFKDAKEGKDSDKQDSNR